MFKLVIDSQKPPPLFNFGELYAYRELLFLLTYRDFKVRYANTVLGFSWAFIQPFLTLVIFTLVFSYVANIQTPVPYPVFAACGLAGWNYFGYVLAQSGTSILSSQSLVTKVYFPRLVIPISRALVGLIDFGIVLVMVVVLMLFYGIVPGLHLLFLPVAILWALVVTLGAGIWMSALTLRFRDFQYIIPFIVQLGIYATPIAYPTALLPDKLRFVIFFNPMAGVVEAFRYAILGIGQPEWIWLISVGVGLIIVLGGLIYFRKTEYIMADIL
jgi:lipopolysaccharide transport system permease protein